MAGESRGNHLCQNMPLKPRIRFNQANYVLGEVKNPRKIFRSATLLAVSTVCVCYMLVNIAYMIVVPKEDQINGSNVGEQFINLTLGTISKKAKVDGKAIINSFMAFSSLGNIIVSTYTAARVKQEIAKEGVLPFSKFIARNYDVLSRLTSFFQRRSSQHKLANAQDSVFYEKTPLGALFVHWFFSLLIISCTWKVSPKTAYTIVLDIYSYTIDAFMAVIVGAGLLYLRFAARRTHWNLKSRSNGIISVIAAFLFFVANAFPVAILWRAPSAGFKLSYSPWVLVPAVGFGLLGSGVLYWAIFVGIVPRIGGNNGKELKVERSPYFHTEHGEPVQVAEVVTFDWVIKDSRFD
jgi:amino acid transporter